MVLGPGTGTPAGGSALGPRSNSRQVRAGRGARGWGVADERTGRGQGWGAGRCLCQPGLRVSVLGVCGTVSGFMLVGVCVGVGDSVYSYAQG